jgi:phage terminase small subunit
MKKPKKLNAQQTLFCKEYIVDFNATRAALAAGYSKKAAYGIGGNLLKKVEIQFFLAELQKPLFDKLEITAERIMREVALIAFANIMDFLTVQPDGSAYIDMSKVTRDQAAALAQYDVVELPPLKTVHNGEEVAREVFKVKIRMFDKLEALEKLMRRFNLVKPMEVNVNHQDKVQYDLPDLARRMAFLLAKAAKEIEAKKTLVIDQAAVKDVTQ